MRNIIHPRVSVVMAVCNGERHVRQAIESILNQTFGDFECIIIDDGSTDGSPDIIAEYAVGDGRIHMVRQANAGLTVSLNRGIARARGEYIARMDADDVSVLTRLEKEVAYLDAHPGIALVACFAWIINDAGETVGDHEPSVSHDVIRARSFFSGQICHPSVMVRADAVRALGGYNERFAYAQDYELWLRLMHGHAVATIPEFLFSWRRSPQGIGRVKRGEQRCYAQKARIAAIRAGLYPSYYYMLLFLPYVQEYIPVCIKRWLKRFV